MIWFTGDINITDNFFDVGFGIGTKIADGLNPFQFIERRDEDIWIGNYEGVASSVSCNQGIYAESFRVDPSVLRGLSHLDYYGLANNHAMEHGEEAYWETVKALQGYGSDVFGTIKQKSIEFEYKNKLITITGLCQRIEATNHEPQYWYNPEYKEIENELNILPSDSFKVLFVHWGNEYINRPSIAQRKFAHWLLDSGFDLIIGMHPHVLQGYEDYNGKRVYYSLGNFVFDMPSLQCKIGAVVSLDFIEGRPVYSENYIKIDDECCPHIVAENNILEQWRFSSLNQCLKVEENSEEYHKQIRKGYMVYSKANHKQLLLSAFSHPGSFYGVLRDFLKRKFG